MKDLPSALYTGNVILLGIWAGKWTSKMHFSQN